MSSVSISTLIIPSIRRSRIFVWLFKTHRDKIAMSLSSNAASRNCEANGALLDATDMFQCATTEKGKLHSMFDWKAIRCYKTGGVLSHHGTVIELKSEEGETGSVKFDLLVDSVQKNYFIQICVTHFAAKNEIFNCSENLFFHEVLDIANETTTKFGVYDFPINDCQVNLGRISSNCFSNF